MRIQQVQCSRLRRKEDANAKVEKKNEDAIFIKSNYELEIKVFDKINIFEIISITSFVVFHLVTFRSV